jgi:predicted pyridoxine 5'-phosphate oxidase superfamily flavin-nucleotide-binding protein
MYLMSMPIPASPRPAALDPREQTMSHRFADIAFTPSVQRLQRQHGSRAQYGRLQAHAGPNDSVGEDEAEFLARADSFYLATVSETGWPYVQHRGGPPGFLRVLTPSQIAFADFRGNLQYVSAGNVAVHDRASIIVMDHVERRRLKLLGHLRFVSIDEVDADVLRRVELTGYRARVERVALFDVAAFDWNCPQHITQRFTLEQIEQAAAPMRARIAELEARLKELGVPA